MDVRLITPDGVVARGTGDLEAIRAEAHGLVWVDLPRWDDNAGELLGKRFGLHPRAMDDCATRCPRCTATPTTCSSCCTPRSAAPGVTWWSSTSSSARTT